MQVSKNTSSSPHIDMEMHVFLSPHLFFVVCHTSLCLLASSLSWDAHLFVLHELLLIQMNGPTNLRSKLMNEKV
ncbi:hypothetical protein Fmac_008863 [Flemingia macrophylla]|uniref:Uncharacterized protein n=1 Tax=Flemingia macrophylla TaxID=520843 RepID=A0ABD1MZT4_9FABA